MKHKLFLALSQSFSSLSNLVLSIFIARNSSTSEFGVFALLYGIYWFLLGCHRALNGESLIALEAGNPSVVSVRGSMALTFSLSTTLALPLFLTSLLLHQPSAVAFSVCIPLLLLQDQARYVLMAQSRAWAAAISDGVWIAFQLPMGLALHGIGLSMSSSWLDGWLLAGGLSMTASLLLFKIHPGRESLVPWSRKMKSLGFRVLGDFVVNSGAQQLIAFVLPVLLSLSALGAVRGSQVAAGPLNVAMTASTILLLPVYARLRNEEEAAAKSYRIAGKYALSFLLIAACASLVFIATPDSVGDQVLGQTWPSASRLAPYICLQAAINGISLIAICGLRATGSAGTAFKYRLGLFPANISFPLIGAYLFDSLGFVLGLLTASAVSALVWHRLLYIRMGNIGNSISSRQDEEMPAGMIGG